MARLLISKMQVSAALAVLAFGFAGCSQTQVRKTAEGAGGVLVETLLTTALDAAFDTNSSTWSLSDEELAQCRPRGNCLPLAHRKEQETKAFIARSRRGYSQLFENSEPDFTRSLADRMNHEWAFEADTSESTSIMLRQPPLEAPLTMPAPDRKLQLEGVR